MNVQLLPISHPTTSTSTHLHSYIVKPFKQHHHDHPHHPTLIPLPSHTPNTLPPPNLQHPPRHLPVPNLRRDKSLLQRPPNARLHHSSKTCLLGVFQITIPPPTSHNSDRPTIWTRIAHPREGSLDSTQFRKFDGSLQSTCLWTEDSEVYG